MHKNNKILVIIEKQYCGSQKIKNRAVVWCSNPSFYIWEKNKPVPQRDICVSVIIVTLVKVTKIWKQPIYLRINEWIKKTCYTHGHTHTRAHTQQYYSAIKKERNPSTCKNMKKPGYKSVIEYYMVPYFRNLKELNSWRRRVEFSLPGVGGGETGRCSKGTKFHSPREISSGDLIYNKLIFNIYLYCLWDFY